MRWHFLKVCEDFQYLSIMAKFTALSNFNNLCIFPLLFVSVVINLIFVAIFLYKLSSDKHESHTFNCVSPVTNCLCDSLKAPQTLLSSTVHACLMVDSRNMYMGFSLCLVFW